jgi:hypothetical protein
MTRGKGRMGLHNCLASREMKTEARVVTDRIFLGLGLGLSSALVPSQTSSLVDSSKSNGLLLRKCFN